MMKLQAQIEHFTPWNEQEARDRVQILQALRENPQVFSRESTLAHITASAWVVNERWDRVLLAYHNLYHSWAWLGGHADGETDLLAVAVREVKEESSLLAVQPLLRTPFSLEVLAVDGHWKRGSYVSSHLHLNVTYLLQADAWQMLHEKPDENSAVAWFSLPDALAASSEPWMQQMIYQKLNEKLLAQKEGPQRESGSGAC